MEGHATTWSAVLVSWAPFMLVLGFWVFFMFVMLRGRQRKYIERHMAFMDRQDALLERIASALERLASKQPKP
jgi:ATP-dependent Zn protease